MEDIFTNIADMQKHIEPLNINGLSGRMLRIKPEDTSKKREFMMVYGHHSSLERMFGIAEDLSQYGTVTMPDLPGFGGMDSFYKIGMTPTLDNLADYLATFVKLRYKNKKVTIVAMSLGFVITTRMLQRHPELTKKVYLLVSMVGFSHRYDFTLSPTRTRLYKLAATVFSRKLPSLFFYNVCLHPAVLRAMYWRMHNAKKKFGYLSEKEKKQAMEFEVILWRDNDPRTYMYTSLVMLNLDNCQAQVDLPVHHISVKGDQYFDNRVVEQHMRVIFNNFFNYEAVLPAHTPSILASKEEAAPLVPESVRALMV